MPLFVHVTDARLAARIRSGGIRPGYARALAANEALGLRLGTHEGVHAMPVVPNREITWQWMREVRRRELIPKAGVVFRAPDGQTVVFGHYLGAQRHAHCVTTASEAAGFIMHAPDARGFEVIIPRKIEPGEIVGLAKPPKTVGWRYFPDAHTQHAPCGCPACQRGEFNSRSLRLRWAAETM